MNRRVQCILIETCNKHILLFHVYFPCKGDPNYAADVEIICTFISSEKDMIDVEQFDIVIAGDFNFDVKNGTDNPDLQVFYELLRDCNLEPSSLYSDSDITYTFRCDSRNVYSFIDDIIIPKIYRVQGSLLFFDIIDDVTNKSDHLAVIFNIAGNNTENVKICDKQKPKFYKKVIWLREAIEQYYDDTGRCLQNVNNRLKLNDFWAENSQVYVNNLYNDIVSSMVSCSEVHVKTVVQRDLRWSKYLDELKRQSRSTSKVWHENGCPINDRV